MALDVAGNCVAASLQSAGLTDFSEWRIRREVGDAIRNPRDARERELALSFRNDFARSGRPPLHPEEAARIAEEDRRYAGTTFQQLACYRFMVRAAAAPP